MITESARTAAAPRVDAAVPGAHSFAAALCGFIGSTAATTLVMVLLSTL